MLPSRDRSKCVRQSMAEASGADGEREPRVLRIVSELTLDRELRAAKMVA